MNESEELRALLRAFVHATGCLSEYLVDTAGDEELEAINSGYPLPDSFDDFYQEAVTWEELTIENLNELS